MHIDYGKQTLRYMTCNSDAQIEEPLDEESQEASRLLEHVLAESFVASLSRSDVITICLRSFNREFMKLLPAVQKHSKTKARKQGKGSN